MMKPISPERFDNAFGRVQTSKIIWTAAAIGERIGRGEDFVRDVLAKMPGTPVRRIGGKLCAVDDELIDFFRPP